MNNKRRSSVMYRTADRILAVYSVQLFKEEVRQQKKGEPISNNLKLKGPGSRS